MKRLISANPFPFVGPVMGNENIEPNGTQKMFLTVKAGRGKCIFPLILLWQFHFFVYVLNGFSIEGKNMKVRKAIIPAAGMGNKGASRIKGCSKGNA